MNENEFNELLKIQRMMASRIIQEATEDNKIKLMTIISKLVTIKNNKIQKETIIIEAMNEGFTEEEIIKLLEELKKDRMIEEAEEGYIKI